MDEPTASVATLAPVVAAAAVTLLALLASAVALRRTSGAAGRFYILKYWIAYFVVAYRKWTSRRSSDSMSNGGYGKVASDLSDRPRDLLANIHAIDSAYFCGFDEPGNWLVARLCRRQKNACEIWLSLYLAGDGLYESPVHPDTQIMDEGGGRFSAGNLNFEVLEDFRRWRISFNGPMRKKRPALVNTQEDKVTEDLVHVKFSFIWEALTDTYSSDCDLSTHLLAAALAGESWSRKYFQRRQQRHQTRYEQAGGFVGSVTVESCEPQRLRLRGFRDRSYGVREWTSLKRYIAHLIALENGTFVVFSVVDFPGCFSRVSSGCVFMPNGERQIIDWTDLQLECVGDDGRPPIQYCFSVSAGSHLLKMKIRFRSGTQYYHSQDRASMCYENIVDVTCESHRGYGIAEFFYRSTDRCKIEQSTDGMANAEAKEEDPSPKWSSETFVVPFDRDVCRESALVGGKASQLGILTKLQTQEKFIVPYGICLTKHAFELHVRSHPAIAESINNLQLAASGELPGCDLATASNNVTKKLRATTLPRELQLAVTEEMIRAFKQDASSTLFAVRSSAIGEDGEELSSAGQMDTLLGVKGDPQSLADAVVSCWASQYTAQAVEYKRQYGQVISNGMGVIIQEMVPSDTSGVLFTQDPTTGNPLIMAINSNFGLGESVVSGVAQPDSIKIARLPGQKLKILEKHAGSKVHRTKIKVGGGTELVTVTDAETACCISDDDIVRLCSLGIRLEELMGGGRDIEWALCDGNIYLLQARPITTFDQPDDFEITHEFDSPHSREDELCTAANIGEMMPGAMTPLTITTFFRSIEKAMQIFNRKNTGFSIVENACIFCKVSNGHAFLNFHAMEVGNKLRNAIADRRVCELALFGQVVQAMTDDDVQSYNSSLPWYSRIKNAFVMIYMLWKAETPLRLWEERLSNYTVTQSSHSEEMYKDICARIPDLTEVWYRGLWGSALSGVSYNVILSILTGGKPCYTLDSCHDVAMLLSSCDDVISATVPMMLKKMATLLRNQHNCNEFVNMSKEEAADWLLSQRSGDIGNSFRHFLQVHGHRCVREADMYERSWAQDPTRVVTTLQSMVSLPEQVAAANHRLSVEELLKLMKTKLNPVGRILLKRLLPWAWRSVGRREWGKSLQVKMNDCFKQAYWALAGAMKREGRIPDEELLFFFTHAEIGMLLKTRSAKLIARAQKRRKIYPKLMKLVFMRDHAGHPVPIQAEPQKLQDVSLQLTGMPVSLGTVRGRACVVLDLQSASALQSGDILIVPFTDIGWSPFFPIISGLVTEIGGLISHGAVVAREYGIPCVVNCPRATQVFKTGDFVELCGDSGTITKLSVAISSSSET